MPGFSIEEFKSQLAFGIAKPSRYNIIIASPDDGVSPEIGMYAEEVELPGKSLATRTMGLYGPAINFPYQEIYTNLRMTFICSADLWERKWFEKWQRKIVNSKSGYFGYYRNYVRDITIQQLDEKGVIGYEGQAIEAWPVTIDNQQFAYRVQNDYQRLTVMFSYVRFLDIDVVQFSSGDSGIGGDLTPSLRPGARKPLGPTLPTLPTPGPPVAQ